MNQIQKGEIVFVRLLLPLMLGILAGIFSNPSSLLLNCAIAIAISSLFSIWFLTVAYNKFKIYLGRWKPGLLVNLLVFSIGFALVLSNNPKLHKQHFANYKSEALIVMVESEPKVKNGIVRFEGKVTQGIVDEKFYAQTGKLLVSVKLQGWVKTYQYGDQLLISSNYRAILPPLNPEEFDYKNFLANRGIHHQLFVNTDQVKLLGKNRGNRIVNYALNLRKQMVAKYERYIPDNEASSVASTLILGYKAELSSEVLSAYSQTGTTHVLSVSGMHVGLVFIVLNALLWFLNSSKKLRIIRASIIISLIWAYALITGFSPSVSRAALMLSFYVFGKALNRSSNSYNLVAISAVFLLIYNPLFLLDVGFQLSYLAVLGLIYFYPKLYHLFYIQNKIADTVWSYVALSCAAQLATFPLALFYFHQFPVYFLISNLFIVLPVTAIMYLGIAFLFIPWEAMLKPIGRILEWGILTMDRGLFYIQELPWATVSNYNGVAFYFVMYLSILAFVIAFQKRRKIMLLWALTGIFVLVVLHALLGIEKHEQQRLVFFSLRKNTAFAFFSSNRSFVFADLDSADKAISYSVNPAVQAQSDFSRFISLNQPFENQWIYSDGNLFKFNNWKLLVWDEKINELNFSKQMEVDAVLLSGRPKISIKKLTEFVRFKLLIIDGSNPQYLVDRWIAEARGALVKVYVLKNNPAYSISLN